MRSLLFAFSINGMILLLIFVVLVIIVLLILPEISLEE